MNEILFFCHIPLVILFLFLALKRGKEALITFISLTAVLANLFVLKQIEFFSFTITCSDVFVVGAILGLNLLQEYFGKEEAKRATKISFFAMIFFALMAKVHLLYAPSLHDTSQESYLRLLSPSLRITAASLLVFFLMQKLDIALFSLLKRAFQDKYLPLRITLSLIFTQFLDTVLFSFLGLYGLVHTLFDIILVSFLVKTAVILFGAPFTALSKRFAKVRA